MLEARRPRSMQPDVAASLLVTSTDDRRPRVRRQPSGEMRPSLAGVADGRSSVPGRSRPNDLALARTAAGPPGRPAPRCRIRTKACSPADDRQRPRPSRQRAGGLLPVSRAAAASKRCATSAPSRVEEHAAGRGNRTSPLERRIDHALRLVSSRARPHDGCRGARSASPRTRTDVEEVRGRRAGSAGQRCDSPAPGVERGRRRGRRRPLAETCDRPSPGSARRTG